MSVAETEPIVQATEKKSNHRAPILRIAQNNILPHPDPATTNLERVLVDGTDVGGYQVVVRKGQFKDGDLAVYIQPDSVIPQTEPFKFIWETYVGLDGKVPDKRRRITVRKFRGEWSEGLLLPITDFGFAVIGEHAPPVGEDVSDLLGITHYDPDAGKEGAPETAHAPRKKFRYPKTLKGWFGLIRSFFRNKGRLRGLTVDVPFTLPVYDVEAYKNYKDTFIPGETVVVTEKIHGSNARFLFLDGVMYAGSRNQWKAPESNTTWHKALKSNPWIEEWCKAHEGYGLYGEVAPTQKGFTYGAKKDEVKFFLFDVRTPDGKWVDYDDFGSFGVLTGFGKFSINLTPMLYYGPFDAEKIAALVDGPSFVPQAGHIREGIVVKTAKERHKVGLGRVQLKLVSNDFLAKDSK